MVSGCGIVGDIEKRMKNILDEVIRRENIILFFDEMHTAFGTGKGKDGTLDIANILKPYVDRGQIKMIGATTTKEYDEYFESDPAFKRRYEKVIIKEPDDSALYEIISCVMDGEESILNVSLSNNINKDKLIESLIRLTMKNHRDQLNMEYNPALVLSILKKAYSYAVYNEHDYLDINDIEEAISKCSLVSKPAKDEFLRYEKDLFIENNKVKSKIIEFNK
jgi:replication-associated recombination protein RarA